MQNKEIALNDGKETSTVKKAEMGSNDHLNLHPTSYPLKLFSPEASIFEHAANNLISNIRKKSRNNPMFNPFERRRMNLHGGTVSEKLISVPKRKVKKN